MQRGPWRCMAGTVPFIRVGGLQEAGEERKEEGEGLSARHCLGPESGPKQEASALGVSSAKESQNCHSVRGVNRGRRGKRKGEEVTKRRGSEEKRGVRPAE